MTSFFYSIIYIIFGCAFLSHFYEQSFWLIINGNGGFVGNYFKNLLLTPQYFKNENIIYFILIFITSFIFLLSINFKIFFFKKIILKIINLFSYWLYILSSIKECYGEDGFHIFLSSKNNVFEFSYDFELKINRKSKPIKKNYSFLLKFFFKLNPFLIISNKFYLPGANLSSFFKKIINQLSLSLFNNLSPDHNFNNIQLLKCKLEAAGHGGSSGRDNAINELAEEYSFILKNAKIKN